MRFSASECVYYLIFNLFIDIYKSGGANVDFVAKEKER